MKYGCIGTNGKERCIINYVVQQKENTMQCIQLEIILCGLELDIKIFSKMYTTILPKKYFQIRIKMDRYERQKQIMMNIYTLNCVILRI